MLIICWWWIMKISKPVEKKRNNRVEHLPTQKKNKIPLRYSLKNCKYCTLFLPIWKKFTDVIFQTGEEILACDVVPSEAQSKTGTWDPRWAFAKRKIKPYLILSYFILSCLILSYLILSSCLAQQRPVNPSIAAVQPSSSRLAFLTDLFR